MIPKRRQFSRVNDRRHMTGARLLRVSILATYWSVTDQDEEERKAMRFTGACAEGVALNEENDNDGRLRSSTSFEKRPGSREEDDRNKNLGACSYMPVSSGSGLGQRLLKRMSTKASEKPGTSYSNVISQNIFPYTHNEVM